MAHARLPYPGEPDPPTAAVVDDYDDEEHSHEHLADAHFYSTTTKPLPADDFIRPRTSSIGATSILDRGRPPRPASRSSFFAPGEQQADVNGARGAGGAGHWDDDAAGVGRDSSDWARRPSEDTNGRPSSFFGMPASPGPDANFRDLPAVAGGAPGPLASGSGSAGPPAAFEQIPTTHERRSSFYGFESFTPPPGTPSPLPAHLANNSNSNNGGDSSSTSYSSHEAPRNGQGRYHSAPYAASRAASLYGIASEADRLDFPPPQLFDHSHLQPGSLASLLSREKTLDLYRANAKKTNDPEVQFEFCVFVMELVGAMQEQQEQTGEAKQKQDGLVVESVALLNKLANRGHVKSQYFLADCFTQGIGTVKGKRDYDKAYPLFMLAGKHGHSEACYRAGQCLENGWGVQKSGARAISLYRRAAVLSHPGAMHRLGLAEMNGELGLSKRPREGVKWLKRAAEVADTVDPPQPQSLHELALLSEKGVDNVIFKDEEYAAELLARASELHYAPSAYKLGECYEYGKMGCPQDSALSIHYYNIAAQQNHREACFALTAWYLVGSPGVLPQSDTEAYLWAKRAADMGLAKAQYAVGYFTEMGIGTHKDAREALDWFRKAAAQGDKRAMDRLRLASSGAVPSAQAFAREATPPPPPASHYKPPPVSVSGKLKGKGKEPTTLRRPQSFDRNGSGGGPGGRPEMERKRSVSTPQAQYMAYEDDGQYGGPGSDAPNYGRPAPIHRPSKDGQQFKPIQPGQARMPPRHSSVGPNTTPLADQMMGKEREKAVLQRRKAGDEKDKDSLVSSSALYSDVLDQRKDSSALEKLILEHVVKNSVGKVKMPNPVSQLPFFSQTLFGRDLEVAAAVDHVTAKRHLASRELFDALAAWSFTEAWDGGTDHGTIRLLRPVAQHFRRTGSPSLVVLSPLLAYLATARDLSCEENADVLEPTLRLAAEGVVAPGVVRKEVEDVLPNMLALLRRVCIDPNMHTWRARPQFKALRSVQKTRILLLYAQAWSAASLAAQAASSSSSTRVVDGLVADVLRQSALNALRTAVKADSLCGVDCKKALHLESFEERGSLLRRIMKK
ncbi:Sel1-like and Tetratricopeptide-like helical domain containing protein [Pseudohyphozyma bogoriensis]|nr:Sel1-like and Tetratricopeptide-like helical domain containing protein [Pseudohyphozyma bogoriensis]